jgi:hypothetical protein
MVALCCILATFFAEWAASERASPRRRRSSASPTLEEHCSLNK